MRRGRVVKTAGTEECADALALEALARGQCITFREATWSMVPTLRPGDLVEVAAEIPAIGEVGVVWTGRDFVAHRVIGRRGDAYILRGDAVGCSAHTEAGEKVVGRVLGVRRTSRNWMLLARAKGGRVGRLLVGRLFDRDHSFLRVAVGRIDAVGDILRIARHIEARLRRRLPPRLGGRFGEEHVAARVLAEDDAEVLAGLLRPGRESKVLRSVRASLSGAEGFYVGIFFGEALVAAGACSPQWKQIGIAGWWFGGDFVEPSMRRRGLGQLLHRARIREARSRGIGSLYVNTAADNHASLGGLRAAGFVEIWKPNWETKLRQHLSGKGARNVRQVILARDV